MLNPNDNFIDDETSCSCEEFQKHYKCIHYAGLVVNTDIFLKLRSMISRYIRTFKQSERRNEWSCLKVSCCENDDVPVWHVYQCRFL